MGGAEGAGATCVQRLQLNLPLLSLLAPASSSAKAAQGLSELVRACMSADVRTRPSFRDLMDKLQELTRLAARV